MRAILVLAAALLLQPHPAPTLDEYPRRVGIDVENYRFELTLSDADDQIDGRAVISIRFTEDGVAELPLDLTSRRPLLASRLFGVSEKRAENGLWYPKWGPKNSGYVRETGENWI